MDVKQQDEGGSRTRSSEMFPAIRANEPSKKNEIEMPR